MFCNMLKLTAQTWQLSGINTAHKDTKTNDWATCAITNSLPYQLYIFYFREHEFKNIIHLVTNDHSYWVLFNNKLIHNIKNIFITQLLPQLL